MFYEGLVVKKAAIQDLNIVESSGSVNSDNHSDPCCLTG